jgi:tetratricopeptide (TPR) repeat protein
VHLQEVSTGKIIFSDKVESPDMNGVFAMVDTMTSNVAGHLLPASQRPEEAPNIEQIGTSNLEAYRHYQKGLELHRNYEWLEALAELEEAVRLDPQFAAAYLHLSYSYGVLGRYGAGVSSLQAVERLKDRLPRLEKLAYAANKAGLSGDVEAAQIASESLLQQAPRDSLNRDGVAKYYVADHPERALQIMKEGIALDPKETFLWNQLAHLEAQLGNEKAALEDCDKYAELMGKDELYSACLSDNLFLFGRNKEAAASLERVGTQQVPPKEYCSLFLAVIYADGGRIAELERMFDCLQKQFPQAKFPQVKPGLTLIEAQLSQAIGDPEAALKRYETRVIELANLRDFTTATHILGIYSSLAITLNEPETALRFASKQNLEGREFAVIAVLNAATGNKAAAEESLQRYKAKNPEVSTYAMDRLQAVITAWIALKNNDRVAMSRVLPQLPSMSVGGGAVLYPRFIRGRARLLLQDYQGAREDLLGTIAQVRNIGNWPTIRMRLPVLEHLSRFYLGQINEATGKQDDAIREYRSFLSHYSNSRSRLPEIAQARAALKRLQAVPPQT